MSKVGIVVPTQGSRPQYLKMALDSIRGAGASYIILVAPPDFDAVALLNEKLIDAFVAEVGTGAANAINLGIRKLPPEIEYVGWLGDDDLLTTNAIDRAANQLDGNSSAVLVFGQCEYMDFRGAKLFTNKSGRWAIPLIRFGPQLIPQPGCLFRRSTFMAVGELRTDLKLSFDLDLLIRLRAKGAFIYIPEVLAKFRWHQESLSVADRRSSVCEASYVRRSHLPKFAKFVSFLWEPVIRWSSLNAGFVVSKIRIKE